tara:strand:- start:159 stop:428 length:270 start_codon:yes stop_codon:yes gene_type:complete
MRKETYIKKMKAHEERFDILWAKMVKDTNDFIEKNPDVTMYSFQNSIEKFTDNLCLSGAWIQDRINGHGYRDRIGLTKKIRKALGFTLP